MLNFARITASAVKIINTINPVNLENDVFLRLLFALLFIVKNYIIGKEVLTVWG